MPRLYLVFQSTQETCLQTFYFGMKGIILGTSEAQVVRRQPPSQLAPTIYENRARRPIAKEPKQSLLFPTYF